MTESKELDVSHLLPPRPISGDNKYHEKQAGTKSDNMESEGRTHKHRRPKYPTNPDGTPTKITSLGKTAIPNLHYVTVFGEDQKPRRPCYYDDEVPTGDIMDNGNLTLDKFNSFDYLFGGKKSPNPDEESTRPQHRKFSSNIPYYGTPEILTTFTISRKLGNVSKIIPVSGGKAWLNTVGDNFLTLIDKTGTRINRSPIYDHCIWDFALNRKHKMFLTVDRSSLVHAITPHGEQTAAGNFLGYQPYGIGVMEDDKLLVCLRPLTGGEGQNSKLVMIGLNGQVMREMETHRDHRTPLFLDPYNVVCTKSGKIFIRDGNTTVVCLSEQGKHLYTWSSHHDDVLDDDSEEEVFNPSRLTSDLHGSLIISCREVNKVYILPVDGKGLRCLLDATHGITDPWGMGVDVDGLLWIACKDRKLHIIKY